MAILPLLTCAGQRYVVLCRQPRLPAGFASFPEIPAGMLDGSGHFTGVAAKELQEETGIEISEDAVGLARCHHRTLLIACACACACACVLADDCD